MKETIDRYINISKGHRWNTFQISSKENILKNEYVKVVFYDDFLIISTPMIDYNGKTYKPNPISSKNWMMFCIANERLITGKFMVDIEDSDEDELVVYLPLKDK